MNRAIIIANGCETDYSYYKNILRTDDYIICADGAINHCIKMNIKPDIWIGDFDSCDYSSIISTHPELKNVETMKLNPIKDETDTHKCCIVALEKGFTDIRIWCASGSRVDHMLANIHLLEFLLKQGVTGILEDSKNIVCLCWDELNVKKERKYLSLIPLDSSVFVNKAEGLFYPLNNYNLNRMVSLGVSNEIVSDNAFLSVKNGLMIVIQSDD